MMANAITGLSIFQWAAESTKGTDLAATSKVLCETFDFTPEDAVYRPGFINGVLLQNTGNEQVITRGTRWQSTGPWSYEQAIHWLEMTIAGAISPTGTNPYTWTYTRNATSIPTLDSFTFERRLNDGSNQIDTAWHYAMCDELTIKGAPRGVLMFDAKGFARRVQSEAITGALSLPTAELMTHGTTALYIDSTWANRGTTVVSAQLLDWSVTIRPGNAPFFTADGRSDIDFPTHVLNSRDVGLTFECTMLVPGSSSQYATEKTAAEAMTLRALELRATSGAKSWKLQFLAKHELGSVFKIDEQDGQAVVKMKLVGSTDATNYMASVLVNATATDA